MEDLCFFATDINKINFVFVFFSIGNDFNGINIKTRGIIDRVKKQNYPFTVDGNVFTLKSPDGYTIYVIDEQSDGDPVKSVVINSNDLQKTMVYWTDLLNMELLEKSDKEIHLTYGGRQAQLLFRKTGNANNIHCKNNNICLS